jgi:hypothetical protein
VEGDIERAKIQESRAEQNRENIHSGIVLMVLSDKKFVGMSLTLSSWPAVVDKGNDHQLFLNKIYHCIGILLLSQFRLDRSSG